MRHPEMLIILHLSRQGITIILTDNDISFPLPLGDGLRQRAIP